MSTLTKEQILKFANAWQAFILLLPWYISTFGIDTLNRLLFGVALLVVFVILFLRKDNTEKVAVAVGTIDDFVTKQAKAKEPQPEASESLIEDLYKLYHIFKDLQKEKPVDESIKEPVPETEVV